MPKVCSFLKPTHRSNKVLVNAFAFRETQTQAIECGDTPSGGSLAVPAYSRNFINITAAAGFQAKTKVALCICIPRFRSLAEQTQSFIMVLRNAEANEVAHT
jgi:hypothetical protein